ncbi:hypothetical protein DK684_17290, partial [Salmonella enterica subsp. diarizonae]|nr:hypothetical protein [Salmonella enterica subsp. diarizonae]
VAHPPGVSRIFRIFRSCAAQPALEARSGLASRPTAVGTKRWGGPAVADAVESVDYPPVAEPGRAVETGKETIRHQKGKGRAKTGIRL